MSGIKGEGDTYTRLRGLAEQVRPAACWAALCGACLIVFLAAASVVPTLFGYRSFALTSSSMGPRLSRGDVIIGSAPSPAALRPGKVIVFADGNGKLVAHRIVAIRDDGALVTKGDENPKPDTDAVPPSHVRIIGAFAVPYAGYPRVWLREHAYAPMLLLLGLLLGLGMLTREALLSRPGKPSRSGTPAQRAGLAPQ